MLTLGLGLWIVLAVLAAACSANRGLPAQDGLYEVKRQSINYDGDRYRFAWVDQAGGIRQAEAGDLKLVRDSRAALEVRQREAILHLPEDEAIQVRNRDRGSSGWWLPFMLGAPWSSGPNVGPPRTGEVDREANRPVYRYPPTDRFGGGDTLSGSVTSERNQKPDYERLRPAPNAVSGQSGGTGSGTAATQRNQPSLSGQASGSGAGTAATGRTNPPAVSGQAGGTGTGGAASGKGVQPPAGTDPAVGGGAGGAVRGGKSSGGFSGSKPSSGVGGRSFSGGGRRR